MLLSFKPENVLICFLSSSVIRETFDLLLRLTYWFVVFCRRNADNDSLSLFLYKEYITKMYTK